MPLTHYAKFDDGQLLFMGRPDGEEIAGVVETIQVCNSWVYIVDEVLKPTVDLRCAGPFNPDLFQPAGTNATRLGLQQLPHMQRLLLVLLWASWSRH